MKFKFLNINTLLRAVVATVVITGCHPDEFGDGNGTDASGLQASFTVTPVEGKNNTYVIKADEVNGMIGLQWDKADGAGSVLGKAVDTVFYPDAGSYDIQMTAIGKGGATVTSTKTVVVDAPDPVSGNLVKGGKMEEGDEADWTKLKINNDDNVQFNFTDGKLVASGGNWGHAGVYQPIQVVAGQKYKVDLLVSGSGATDVWFEVYVGTQEPQQLNDYTNGGIRIALNTWAGCGKDAFNGKLSSISCAGNGNVVQFDQSGTVYLLIKSGGANLGDTGISIDNVEFRGTN